MLGIFGISLVRLYFTGETIHFLDCLLFVFKLKAYFKFI